MRLRTALSGLAVLLAACAQPSPPPPDPCQGVTGLRASTAGPDWALPYVPGEVLVVGAAGMRPGGDQSLRAAGARQAATGIFAVPVPAGNDERGFAERLARETGRVVQPNYIYRPLATPNDPLYPQAQQDYLRQINMPAAWNVETRGARVAVIDTGADFDHPDLQQPRLLKGKDFCPVLTGDGCQGSDADPSDAPSNLSTNAGHGTHVAGVLGAATNNTRGMAGITWAGEILVVKAFGYDAAGAGATTASLARSIEYAVAQGARVINMSLGLRTYDRTADPGLAAAIAAADAADVLMVAAAGNYDPSATSGCKTVFYPASDPRVVAVGSVGWGNALSDFSARGPELELVAPGENVGSTRSAPGPADAYELRSGTSQATPQVAGVAALVRGRNPGLSAARVRSILRATARDLGPAGRDDSFGYGLLDAGAALAATPAP